PRVARIDPVVDFDWGGGSPAPEVGPDQFSVRWRGRVTPRFSETYNFHTISDDGIRLWIGGELVIDQWNDHAPTEHAGAVVLEAGRAYDLRLEMYENGGGAVARLLWSSASQAREVIPAGALQPFEDREGPWLVGVDPLPSGRELRVRFSEALDPASASNPGNYAAGPGRVARQARPSADGMSVVVEFSPAFPEGIDLLLEVSGVRDASEQRNPVAAGTRRPFTTLVRTPGYLRREVWFNVPGALVSDLTGSPRFQEPPDLVDLVPSFETPSNLAEAYGQRLSGWIVAPQTGDYVFYVSSDDQSEVYLSTDADPANRRLICREPEWNGSRVWTAGRVRDPVNPENRSGPIRLEAGRRYYVEALHKETYGGDNLAVTWAYQGAGNAFLIEAEDFDFGGGQSKPAASVMPYPGGAYAGESAVAGVDFADPGGNESPVYRAATQGMGMIPNADTLRPGYVSTNNFKVGWWDDGDWANYTRTVPAGRYQVYGRLSSGGAPIQASLDRVTGGMGTPDQVTEPLGVFRSPASGGWDSFLFVPLSDAEGNPVAVELGGTTTLRFTKTGGNLDFNYLLLSPLGPGASPGGLVPRFEAPANGSEPIGGAHLEGWQPGDGAGSIRRDVYLNVPMSDPAKSGQLADLRAQGRFPGQPDAVGFPMALEAPTDVADNYGQVLSGWLIPPVSGDYRFYMASDDQGELWLSTDADPARKVLIAREPSWAGGPRDWTGARRNGAGPENRSGPIRLEAGRRYYLEALQTEGYGRDYLGVTWQMPGQLVPAAGSPPIPGQYLSLRPGAGPPRAVVTTPGGSVAEETALVLSVYAEGLPPFRHQWLRNGEPIPGATRPTLRFDPVRFETENGAEFALRVQAGNGAVTSAPVRLTVVRDTTAPTLVGVSGRANHRLELAFSEPMDPGTASQAHRYQLSGGLVVRGAAVSADRTRVVLTTGDQPPDTDYTVTVDAGVTDDAPLRNPLAGNRSGSFRSWRVASGFLNREVYLGIPGNELSSLRASPAFPHFPDSAGVVTTLETPSNVADQYGVRLSGFLEAPETGDYVFHLAADDQGEFWLSTDTDPANLRLLAREQYAVPPRTWFPARGGAPGTMSAPVRLEAGRRYYLEALMKNGGRPEHLGVTWQLVSSFAGAFTVEAEDFNFGGGRHLPEASGMPYAGGAYAGRGAVEEVDFHDPGPVENLDYRRPPWLFGNATAQGGEVQLTRNVGSQQGSLVLSPDGVPGPGLDVAFELYIGDGSGADGFSFNYGVLPHGSFGEQGAGAGLRVQFDTYPNGWAEGFDDEANTVEVWYANTRLAKVPGVTLRTASHVPVRIRHDAAGLRVEHNGVTLVENLLIPGWNPQPGWRLGWGARTGGLSDHHRVRQLVLTQPATTVPAFDQPGVALYVEPADRGRVNQPALANDWAVGWLEPGDWMNYTRVFPAGRYRVLARVASGGAPVAASLSRVAHAGQADQTAAELGVFQSPATGGWSNFALVPLVDAAGDWVSLEVAGEDTFRFTLGNGNANLNYLLFVPEGSLRVSPAGVGGPLTPPNGSAPIGSPFLHGWQPPGP
ncbi:MAG: PA14 domain-containing protein, partial [Verrucomicrobiota bacterium]